MLCGAAIRYLLVIYQLSGEGAAVRSVDIANRLQVSRASVVKTLKRLTQTGMIYKEHYGRVQLTPLGLQEAARMDAEYTLLRTFFSGCLQVGEPAKADALHCLCGLSDESRRRLIELATGQGCAMRWPDAAGL